MGQGDSKAGPKGSGGGSGGGGGSQINRGEGLASPSSPNANVENGAVPRVVVENDSNAVEHTSTHSEDEDVSFNYNSESSEEEIKFPTAVAIDLPEMKIEDPLVSVDTSLKRVAKDFIGSA